MNIEDDKEHEYKPTNREKTQEPKSGFFWCLTCDRQLVSVGGKCKNCGSKIKSKRFKK